MTILIGDIASYQGALTLSSLRGAGFTGVNLKVSHGLGTKSVHPDVARYAAEAMAARMRVCTFHYLTDEAAGWAQAERTYDRLRSLDLLYGTAHQLDVESDPAPSLTQVRTYLETMTAMLARPVALYTGDWWWKARPGWNVSDLTPYLWAAPNGGYRSRYPGDTHADWIAGYGGWPQLSVMQYAVAPVAGIRVSMSAIRNADVWTDLTQGRKGMTYAPDSLKTARKFWLNTITSMDPLSMGIVGDDAHKNSGNSYHLGDDANGPSSYSIVESSRDRNGLTDAASALDIGNFSVTVAGKKHTLYTFNAWLVAQCRDGAPDTADIREVIYTTDGTNVRRWDRLGKRSTGDKSHTSHTHVSYFRDSEKRDKTALYRRYFTEIGLLEGDDDMATITQADFNSRMDEWWKSRMTPPAAGETVSGLSPLGLMRRAPWNLPVAEGVTMYNVMGEMLSLARREAAEVPPTTDEMMAAFRAAIGTVEASSDETAAILAAVLGDRAAEVGRLLAGGA